MARLRKLTEDRTKARQISAYDEDWAAIKRAAKQAGLTISQFLISSVKNARQPANPVHLIWMAEVMQDVTRELARVADGLAKSEDGEQIASSVILVAIERRLAAVMKQASR